MEGDSMIQFIVFFILGANVGFWLACIGAMLALRQRGYKTFKGIPDRRFK